VAVDHNQLVMDMMNAWPPATSSPASSTRALRGHQRLGQANNWALAPTRQRTADPGDTPHDNLQFPHLLSAIIKGVHENSLLLRASIASSGNDHRLGANEAPPAIMSVSWRRS